MCILDNIKTISNENILVCTHQKPIQCIWLFKNISNKSIIADELSTCISDFVLDYIFKQFKN